MKRYGAVVLWVFLVLSGPVAAADWPSFNHDHYRSGLTGERLELPLVQAWTFKAPAPPKPAWPRPAKQDYWHRHYNLRATITYDCAFHVVGSGELVYFGSSADGKIYALDARTGQLRWTFFTEGPVRLAPVVAHGKVYAGSDDGRLYCLLAKDGSLLWEFNASQGARLIPGNGAMISARPIRSGLVVDGGMVYFTAGLFPMYGAYLFALEAEDGRPKWKRKLEICPQGYMLASADRLYVPTGRTSPVVFRRSDGKALGALPSAGGAYALLSDNILVTGPGRGPKQIYADSTETRDTIATFGGLRMLINGPIAYMQSESELSAFNRTRYLELSRDKKTLVSRRKKLAEQLKRLPGESPLAKRLQQDLDELDAELDQVDRQMRGCYIWRIPCKYPYSMIMADKVLLLGGDGEVAAIDSADGRTVWTAPVKGRAFGLSVVNAALYVSTDTGQIHCFGKTAAAKPGIITTGGGENPYPRDELTALYARAAEYIAERSPVRKGYCLVLDCGYGRLAYELAKRTDLKIIGVEADPRKVTAARSALDRAGLYGRVVIHHRPAGILPYTKYFANLIVSDQALHTGELPDSPGEVFELLRPWGGMVIVGVPADEAGRERLQDWGRDAVPGWKVQQAAGLLWGSAARGPLEGAGEWTHSLADPGNTACSNDTLIKGPMRLQWFGRPGPERMIDRHHRNVPPLCKDGRLFVPGDCVIFAMDAYNGTIQWEAEIPDSRRLGVFLDSGSMAVDANFLYVVTAGQCLALDVRTGERHRLYVMPQLIADEPRDWGYIACLDKMLLGSGRRKGASYTETSHEADSALWYRNMKLVTSDYLFALDKATGRSVWQYKGGIILNTTITVGEGRTYFAETTSPAALADKLGRMPLKTLFDGGAQYIVALDNETGRTAFKRKIETGKFGEVVYLNYAKRILLLSGSRLVGKSVRYYYEAFDSRLGAPLWSAEHDTGLPADGAHGEFNRHPTILGNTVYAWPYAYELKTGRRIRGWKMDRRGHGCGGVSASAQCLFWRGGNPWMYDLGPGGGPVRLTAVTRPGCWINIIPAGGLVLIPEASSGCTCGFSIQTSIALIPEQLLN